MREVRKLLDRLRESTGQSRCFLQLFGDGSWSVQHNDIDHVASGGASDDPTDDIIAALKAKLPPTKEEALADLDAFIKHTPYPYSMAQNTHLQTVRRYLEAQKE